MNWRGGTFCLLLIGVLGVGCRHNMAQTNSPSPKPDINAVLADHDKQLMAEPAVVRIHEKKRLSVPPMGGTGKGALGQMSFLALNLRRGRRDRPSCCRLLRGSGREQARQL